MDRSDLHLGTTGSTGRGSTAVTKTIAHKGGRGTPNQSLHMSNENGSHCQGDSNISGHVSKFDGDLSLSFSAHL